MDDSAVLAAGRAVVRSEAAALLTTAASLDASFVEAARRIAACAGRVVVLGVGKSWLIGQKISATLASVGTPSYPLHAGEAVHGDLGRLVAGDLVLALSNSGRTDEVLRCVPGCRARGVALIALTADADSPLGRAADLTLAIGDHPEPGPLGLAPTASTTAALAVGDALALTAAALRGFSAGDWAAAHPGGALGLPFKRVREVMRQGPRVAVAAPDHLVRDALWSMTRARAGMVSVVDQGRVVGVFTDGDLRRSLGRDPGVLDRPIGSVMTASPLCAPADALLAAACASMAARQVDEVPVVDPDGALVGVLDVQDLLTAR